MFTILKLYNYCANLASCGIYITISGCLWKPLLTYLIPTGSADRIHVK